MADTELYKTDFLFSSPSFLSGAGSVMNLAGNYYKFNTSETESEADKKAIENDFIMVGQDISTVIKELKSAGNKLFGNL